MEGETVAWYPRVLRESSIPEFQAFKVDLIELDGLLRTLVQKRINYRSREATCSREGKIDRLIKTNFWYNFGFMQGKLHCYEQLSRLSLMHFYSNDSLWNFGETWKLLSTILHRNVKLEMHSWRAIFKRFYRYEK